MILRIKDGMLYAFLFEKLRKLLGLFDRNRTDKDRLSLLVTFNYLIDDGTVLASYVLVNNVGMVLSYHRLVRRNLDDVEIVDLSELRILC